MALTRHTQKYRKQMQRNKIEKDNEKNISLADQCRLYAHCLNTVLKCPESVEKQVTDA